MGQVPYLDKWETKVNYIQLVACCWRRIIMEAVCYLVITKEITLFGF